MSNLEKNAMFVPFEASTALPEDFFAVARMRNSVVPTAIRFLLAARAESGPNDFKCRLNISLTDRSWPTAGIAAAAIRQIKINNARCDLILLSITGVGGRIRDARRFLLNSPGWLHLSIGEACLI